MLYFWDITVIPLQNECFQGYTGISLSVCVSICVSVCVQNTMFCQSAGRGIESHSVAALVLNMLKFRHNSRVLPV